LWYSEEGRGRKEKKNNDEYVKEEETEGLKEGRKE